MHQDQYNKICFQAKCKILDFIDKNYIEPTKILMTNKNVDEILLFVFGDKPLSAKLTKFHGLQVLRSDDISDDEIYVF